MVLTATSSYTLSNQISIFRRFHQSYKAQRAKRVLLSQEGFSRSSPLFYFCLTFRVLENSREMDGYARCRRIPAVFHIKSHSAEHAQTKCLYALVGYFNTSYPTRAHGVMVIYSPLEAVNITFSRPGYLARHFCHLGK